MCSYSSNQASNNIEQFFICFHESFSFSLLPHAEEYESMKISADLELPKKTKYLLVAAYIASFVSSKHDKRLFCRQSSKRKKSNKNPSGDCPENKIASLLGPRQFTLNRVLNIFSALTAQRNLLTASLLQQVKILLPTVNLLFRK